MDTPEKPTEQETFFRKKSLIFHDFCSKDPSATQGLTPHEMIQRWAPYLNNSQSAGYSDIKKSAGQFKLAHWAFLYFSNYHEGRRFVYLTDVFGKFMPDLVALRWMKRDIGTYVEQKRRDIRISERYKQSVVSFHKIERAIQMIDKPATRSYLLSLLTPWEKTEVARNIAQGQKMFFLPFLGENNYKTNHSYLLAQAARAQQVDFEAFDYLLQRSTPSKNNSSVLVALCERPKDAVFYSLLNMLLPHVDVSQAMQAHAVKSLSVLIPHLSNRAWKKIKHMKCYEGTEEYQKRTMEDALSSRVLQKNSKTNKM